MLMETRAYILPLTLLGQGIERRTVDNGVFHLGPSEVTARKLLFFSLKRLGSMGWSPEPHPVYVHKDGWER